MYSSSVFWTRTRRVAGTAIFAADKGTTAAGFADRNAILSNGKVVFVFFLDPTFFIQVDKRYDTVVLAVLIIRHCVMGRIKQEFFYMKIRKKAFHPEKALRNPWESCMDAGWRIGKTGRLLSESDATNMYRSNPILNKYNTVKKKLKAKVTERKELKSRKEQLIFQAECSTDKDMTNLSKKNVENPDVFSHRAWELEYQRKQEMRRNQPARTKKKSYDIKL